MDPFGGTYTADGAQITLGAVYVASDLGQEVQVDPAIYAADPAAVRADYALAHAEALLVPGHYLGVYYGGSGPVYLDVSKTFADPAQAILYGERNGQESIWDNGAEELLYLDTPRGRVEAARLGKRVTALEYV